MADAGRAAYDLAGLTKAKLLQYSGIRRWLYAVSNAKKTGHQLNIVSGLDSLTAGAGNSSYIDYFRPLVQAALGNGGLGFVAYNSSAVANEFGGSASTLGSSGATQINNSSFSPSTDTIYDPNLYAMTFAGSGGYVNLQDTLRVFTKATCWYLQQPSGGTFKFGDGQYAPGLNSVNTDNATKQIASLTYTGTFPSQVNNIVQASSIVGPVRLMGVDFKNGTSGARVHRLAQGGTQARVVAQLDGPSFTSFLQGIGCDLYILNAGMNDSGVPFSAAQYEADIRTILTRVRAANPNCAILIIGPNDTSDTVTRNPILQTYHQKLQLISQDYEALYLDNRWTLKTYAIANANGWMIDGVHPSALANRLIAQEIFNSIGGQYLADVDSLLLN
jgi:lysophospholipase L1-like esterase